MGPLDPAPRRVTLDDAPPPFPDVRSPAMSLLSQLSSLALDALSEASDFVGGAQIGAGATGVVRVVLQRFVDHSSRLTRALERSSARAWRAVEVALAGQ